MIRTKHTPQMACIRERSLFIRASRVFCAVAKRRKSDRDYHAKEIRKWREDCWRSYRQLFDIGLVENAGSPWSWYSIRTSLKCGS